MLRKAVKQVAFSKTTPIAIRAFSNVSTTHTQSNVQPNINVNVPGLSDKCVKVPNTPVGPGASKDKEYKNPEYFCYHQESFAEAEVELAKFRLPAPSNKVPFNR